MVIGLRDRVELVIVAPGALGGYAEEGGGRGVDEIFETLVFVFERIVRFIVPSSPSGLSARMFFVRYADADARMAPPVGCSVVSRPIIPLTVAIEAPKGPNRGRRRFR